MDIIYTASHGGKPLTMVTAESSPREAGIPTPVGDVLRIDRLKFKPYFLPSGLKRVSEKTAGPEKPEYNVLDGGL